MFKKLILAATFLAFGVVVLGAFVRLSDAGLGCPDWPGCYGKLSPAHAKEAIAQAQALRPDGPVSTHKAWKEMVHRYFASSLGLLIVIIGILAWMKREKLKQGVGLPTFLIGLVILQGLFGMWTVTLKLTPIVVTLHLLGGMTTLALLTWLLLRQSRDIPAVHWEWSYCRSRLAAGLVPTMPRWRAPIFQLARVFGCRPWICRMRFN